MNTVARGRRFCNQSSVTTPNAAPKPSAVISTPKAALPPLSTSFAKLGPSGIIAPAPMMPMPSPSITPRTSVCFETNCDALLDLAEGLGPVDARAVGSVASAGSGAGRRSRPSTRNVQASNDEREQLLVDLERADDVEVAEHRGEPREQREDDRRDRERAVRRGERQGVRRLQLLLGDEVRHRRRLRRSPQQRQDLETERDEEEAGQVLDEREEEQEARATDVAEHHHLAPVEPVDDHPADGGEEEARDTRVVMTRLTAAPELFDTRAAIARMAIRPIQSPRLDTTCAIQSRRKGLLSKHPPRAGRDRRLVGVRRG